MFATRVYHYRDPAAVILGLKELRKQGLTPRGLLFVALDPRGETYIAVPEDLDAVANVRVGDKLSLVDTLEDVKAEDPVAAFETEETKYLLARAINTLPEREKIVVTLYYYEGLTLAEIGQVLGVTESRICQMHTKAVLQLRGKLAEGNS